MSLNWFSNSGQNYFWYIFHLNIFFLECMGPIISDIIPYFKRQQMLNKIITQYLAKESPRQFFLITIHILFKLLFMWLYFLSKAVLILLKALKIYLGV